MLTTHRTIAWGATGGLVLAALALLIVPGVARADFTVAPTPNGLTITTYTGSLAEFADDGEALALVSAFATVDGNFVGYIFGAPIFVNDAFTTHFAGGLTGHGLIVRAGSEPEHTGVAALDAIIAAVLAGDGDLLSDLLIMRACPDEADCEHIAPGERSETFPFTACAGSFAAADGARDAVRREWGAGGPNFPGIELHAVYVTNHRPFNLPAHYALVFRNPIATGMQYRELLTNDSGEIVLVSYGCGAELPNPDLVESWIVEPLP